MTTEKATANSLKDITPETKIGEFLNNYPELEQLLIELAPPFRKLRNPLLRRTVARITSLRQAAVVGNVSLGVLITRLREAAGLSPLEQHTDQETTDDPGTPDWVFSFPVVQQLDARPIIENGGHPLDRVIKDLLQIEADQIYELVTPFMPAPLIDVAKQKGFMAWTKQEAEDQFITYFAKE